MLAERPILLPWIEFLPASQAVLSQLFIKRINISSQMIDTLNTFLPFMWTVTAVCLVLWIIHKLLIGRHKDLGNEKKFPRQLIMLGLTLLGILVTVLVLPINESSRNQLIGLIGILISGVLALSSTTIISNLMAGVLLRMTKSFRVGDFVRIGEHFGRVSGRGLFDTEIQTETREIIALPNTFCISNPVSTILRSGTIISATLSLGYDIDHRKLEKLLVEAATASGLGEPFVHIMDLGNFSVVYRVSGFLEETKHVISERSNLYGHVLDTLHKNGIEIMSPSYMNQRQLKEGSVAIPENAGPGAPKQKPKTAAEDIAFDKAEEAEALESEKEQLLKEIDDLEATAKAITDEVQRESMQQQIQSKKDRLKVIEETASKEDERDSKASPK